MCPVFTTSFSNHSHFHNFKGIFMYPIWKNPFSIPTICNKSHVDILKNAPLRTCWKQVISMSNSLKHTMSETKIVIHINTRLACKISFHFICLLPVTCLLSQVRAHSHEELCLMCRGGATKKSYTILNSWRRSQYDTPF